MSKRRFEPSHTILTRQGGALSQKIRLLERQGLSGTLGWPSGTLLLQGKRIEVGMAVEHI